MSSSSTLYRRPLPAQLVPFSSAEGRSLFEQALADGTLNTFFPLIEQFHTQAEPEFCGLGSLVMALNALGIDPGRIWRGSWRWFSEELLDCCTPLSKVKAVGVSLDEVACLAQCNGAYAHVTRPEDSSLDAFRRELDESSQSTGQVLIVAYSRAALGQTGVGHFSPIGGYHRQSDRALVLDVARFKYPPYWAPVSVLFEAMKPVDPETQRSRGWVSLRSRATPSAVAQVLVCSRGLLVREVFVSLARDVQVQLAGATSLQHALNQVHAVVSSSELAASFALRSELGEEARELIAVLRRQLEGTPLFLAVRAACAAEVTAAGAQPRDIDLVVTSLWLMITTQDCFARLTPEVHAALHALLQHQARPEPLAREVEQARNQLRFLLDFRSAEFAEAPSAACQTRRVDADPPPG